MTDLETIDKVRAAGGFIVGADEVGWGPCAGPLVVCAATAPTKYQDPRVTDSKALTEKKREVLYDEYIQKRWPRAIVEVEPQRMDKMGPGPALTWAFQEALDRLTGMLLRRDGVRALVVVDGSRKRLTAPFPVIFMPKGDAKVFEVGLASILAKVHRDRTMVRLHEEFPAYGWASNKGYPSKQHKAALTEHGPTKYHRYSYDPVKQAARLHPKPEPTLAHEAKEEDEWLSL
jgi:ribonuclease HII